VLMGMKYRMAPSTVAMDPVAQIFIAISEQVATLNIAYEGPDKDSNLRFRMPPGTPLLTQAEATKWARRIYDAIMKSQLAAARDFVEKAPNFKIIAPR
jgi:hypothetical protein